MNSLIEALILVSFSFNAFCDDSKVTFSKDQMQLGGQSISVEVAKTQAQLERGLMFRKKMDNSAGMLFIYERPTKLNFWMKNTFIPLSIGFFDAKKELIDIQEMEAVQSEMQTHIPTYESHGEAQFALEMNKGWFQRHNIKLKAKFKLLGKSHD